MKFVLVVLVALGLTMAWQATVVADNNQQQAGPNVTSLSASPVDVIQPLGQD